MALWKLFFIYFILFFFVKAKCVRPLYKSAVHSHRERYGQKPLLSMTKYEAYFQLNLILV